MSNSLARIISHWIFICFPIIAIANTENNDYGENCAEQESIYENPETNTAPTSEFDILNLPHQTLSTSLENLVQSVDHYFADDDVYYESSGSYIRFTPGFVWQEDGKISYDGDLKTKIELPSAKRKLNLLLETDPQQALSSDIDRFPQDTPRDVVENKDLYGGIQTILRESKLWNVRFSLGLKFQFPMDPYARVRANRTFTLGLWEPKINQSLYWFKSDGFGSNTTLRFDREIAANLLLRATSEFIWKEETHYLDLSQLLVLVHQYDKRTAFSYEIGIFGVTQPVVQATNYRLLAHYRRDMHKKWIFLDLSPQILFYKNEDFNPQRALYVNIEFVFGTDYL